MALTGLWLSWAAASVLASALSVAAEDELVVLSPHRKSLQDEFIPLFRRHYERVYGEPVRVSWMDLGGTSDDVRFLRSRFASNAGSAGVDVFWGGGSMAFDDLEREGILAPLALSPELRAVAPRELAGVRMTGTDDTWHASAASSFGIFYNRAVLEFERRAEPRTWSDLARLDFRNDLSQTDPRRSGTASSMNVIVLEALGWEQGWKVLTAMAGNTRRFTHSSSDPIRAVVSGDAAAAPAIDFYALAQVVKYGEERVMFVLPPGQTALDPDPIAMVRGAPNPQVARRFIEYILSAEAQMLLILPEGAPQGPRNSTLGRMAVNSDAYRQTEGRRPLAMNPFELESTLILDPDKAARLKRPLNDLIGTVLVDAHRELKLAWTRIQRDGLGDQELSDLSKPFATEAELLAMDERWDDAVFRNETINTWLRLARHRYERIAQ